MGGELTERPGEVRTVDPALGDADLPFRENRHPSWERWKDSESPNEGSFEVESCKKGGGKGRGTRSVFGAKKRETRRDEPCQNQ